MKVSYIQTAVCHLRHFILTYVHIINNLSECYWHHSWLWS